MLKQEIQYTDFNDNQSIDTLYFNLSKTEIADNLQLIEAFTELQEIFRVEHDLDVAEIQKVLNLVKEVMRLSYGVKSTDGKSFVKSEDQWTAFTMTAAYDHFLMSLFEDPDKANAFLSGVMPQDIMREAERLVESGQELPISVSQAQKTSREEVPVAPRRPQDRLPKKAGRVVETVTLPEATQSYPQEFESREEYDAFLEWNRNRGADRP